MRKRDLTQGDERQLLVQMTLPMIWGIFAILSMNLADTYFVGQLGTAELAAMGFTFPVVMITTSLAFGIGTGAASLVSRAIGSQSTELVQSYTTQSILIAFILAMLVALGGWLSIDSLFLLLGAPEHLLHLIHQYMDIWYLGSFLLVVPMVGNAAIRAAGNTKLPSYVMISVAVVNFVLDPMLIFGWFGLPALGLQGAALATLISNAIALLIGLYVLKFKFDFLTLEHCYHNVWARWKSILTLAIPASATNLIAPIAVAITTALVAPYGSDAVAGFGVASRIESFMLIIFLALSTILTPFAGQNWGANRFDRLQRTISLVFRFSMLWGLAVAILLWLVADPVIHLFSRDPEVVTAARWYLWLVPITFGLLGVVMMTSSIANGIGNPKPALWMTLTRLLLLYLPLALLLFPRLGLTGLYMATAIANFVVGVAAMRWSMRKCERAENA